jgi:hypothetical protein
MDAADVPGLLRGRYEEWSWSLVQRHPGEVAVWRLDGPAGRTRDTRYLKVAVASSGHQRLATRLRDGDRDGPRR